MQKYIVFQAESGEDEGWRQRKLQHSQALTFIIAENWDSSNEPIPEPGYRPVEFVRVESEHDKTLINKMLPSFYHDLPEKYLSPTQLLTLQMLVMS